jgi:hypothetical protein
MNIVFATTSLPHGQTTGGEIASQAFIDAIRVAGHSVRVIGFSRKGSSLPAGSTSAGGRAIETASAGAEKYVWLARSLLSGRPYVCEKFRAKSYLDQIRRLTGQRKADVLVIDHAQMGWLFPQSHELAEHIILIAHNQEAPLYAAEAANSRSILQRFLLNRDSRLLSRLEPLLANNVDQVWTLSEADHGAFSAMTDPGKVSLMPLAGRAIPPRPKSALPLYDIGLLGTWAWEVNGRGLDWFAREVAPFLPAHISIAVAGRGSERVNGMLPNLQGIGFVDNPIAFIHQSRVLAVPTCAGSGIQLKTIEAVASGTPTVSTSMGVRGLNDLPPSLLIADTPQDFAIALQRQLRVPLAANSSGHQWAKARREAFLGGVSQKLRQLEPNQLPSAAAFENAAP